TDTCMCTQYYTIYDNINLNKEGKWKVIISAKDAYKEFEIEVKPQPQCNIDCTVPSEAYVGDTVNINCRCSGCEETLEISSKSPGWLSSFNKIREGKCSISGTTISASIKLDVGGTWTIKAKAGNTEKTHNINVKFLCNIECDPIPSQATVGQTISIRCKCSNCNEKYIGYVLSPTNERKDLKCVFRSGYGMTTTDTCMCTQYYTIYDNINLNKEGKWKVIISAKDAYKEFEIEVKKCQLELLSLSPSIIDIPSDLCGKTINILMDITYRFSGDCKGEKIVVRKQDGSTFCELSVGETTRGRCSGDYNVPLSSGTYVFTATYKGLSSVSNSINVRCSTPSPTPSPTPGEGGSPGDRHKFLAPFPISINLKKGWNLISNPTDSEVSVEDLKNFGCSIKGKLIYYDSETKKWVRTDKMLPDDKGYWIYLNNECSITLVPSEKLNERNLVLSKGWNLVNGLDGITCKDLEKYGCKVRMRNNNCFISYINNAWRYLNKTEIGKGYWIYCE
ncbi:MAG: hypothetical protein QW678_01785, partial [Candidatus Aenigmatarchaeota archaeon]